MVKSYELKSSVVRLRALCGNYPVRFTSGMSGLSYSTVNRFINGDNPKLSTITNLMEAVKEDKDLESKYEKWKKLNSADYKFKQYKGN